ncbi:MAG TPA: NAD(P)H-dependent oxidoreductase [Rhodopila sp.]|nr:NAD(P)H-dependent oxidoreductase [Rhodopila sp.]
MSSSAIAPVRLLGLSGSLRRASHCTAILRTLADALSDRARLDLFDLAAIPLYNQDLDADGGPDAVRALKAAIAAADGVVLVSPEFNYGMSGVLKNALDWASRPAYRSVFKGKPSLVITASPAFTGGVRAQAQIIETLVAMLAHVVATPQVVVAAVHEKVVEGRLVDEAALRFALGAVDALLHEIALRKLASAAA